MFYIICFTIWLLISFGLYQWRPGISFLFNGFCASLFLHEEMILAFGIGDSLLYLPLVALTGGLMMAVSIYLTFLITLPLPLLTDLLEAISDLYDRWRKHTV